MQVISAHTSSYEPLAYLLKKSADKYGIHIKQTVIPSNFDRPSSWFKIPYLIEQLKKNPQVLWVDCDCLFTNRLVGPTLKDSSKFLGIAADPNGINCGVMLWHSTEAAFNLLNEVWHARSFLYHRWWENAALHSKVKSEDYELIDKTLYNAYPINYPGCPSDKTSQSMICHLPGLSFQQRLDWMSSNV